MVISHVHRYLFVELPRTGSTAISRELIKNYEGVRILRKHATYFDFLKIAKPEEKKYFVFSCIRNPLDDAVSRYFKLKTDHRNQYTDPKKIARKKNIAERVENFIYRDIQKEDPDFQTFFLKYYILPYNNWASLGRKYYNYVIRFEKLQADFDTALRLLEIEPKRPLPAQNSTSGRGRDFTSYYSPKTILRAKRVFGPFMKEWGYEFPAEWGIRSIPWWNQLEFKFFNTFKDIYWLFLRSQV